MALIHPPDMSLFDDVSEGEREVFHFLTNSPRPERDFIGWYRPRIRSVEPDFVLLSNTQGLLVIEVKDWANHQIKGADRVRPTAETREGLMRLLYVAMTRAKHRLVIPYVEDSEFIERMRACL
jgi:hypothetical protein